MVRVTESLRGIGARSPILRYTLVRLLAGAVSVLAVSLLVFLGTEMLPGDAATALLGQYATPAAVAALQQSLGLDLPLHTRYLNWLGGALTGDFGISLSNSQPVMSVLGTRFVNSLILAAVAATVTVPISVGIGILAAAYKGSWFDSTISAVSSALQSMPSFLIGYLLVFMLAVKLGWFPPLSSVRPNASFYDWFRILALPVLTLLFVAQAHILRLTRAAVLDTMSTDYVQMARIKGVAGRSIFVRHALPNAMSPIVSIAMITVAHMIVDIVVIETVFNYPGLGKLMVDAVAYRDIPMVQACAVLFSIVFIGLNLLADVLAMALNPRQRLPRQAG